MWVHSRRLRPLQPQAPLPAARRTQRLIEDCSILSIFLFFFYSFIIDKFAISSNLSIINILPNRVADIYQVEKYYIKILFFSSSLSLPINLRTLSNTNNLNPKVFNSFLFFTLVYFGERRISKKFLDIFRYVLNIFLTRMDCLRYAISVYKRPLNKLSVLLGLQYP